WLVNEGVVLERGPDRIGVAGLVYTGGRAAGYAAVARATFKLVLNHTPDLLEEAAERGAHLYLCGHTHGGQVRVPFWGAIVTNSKTGKRYEAVPCSPSRKTLLGSGIPLVDGGRDGSRRALRRSCRAA